MQDGEQGANVDWDKEELSGCIPLILDMGGTD